MTSLKAALLRAIVEAPEDRTVQLAYADWLVERGREDEADVLRSAVELNIVNDRVSILAGFWRAARAARWKTIPLVEVSPAALESLQLRIARAALAAWAEGIHVESYLSRPVLHTMRWCGVKKRLNVGNLGRGGMMDLHTLLVRACDRAGASVVVIGEPQPLVPLEILRGRDPYSHGWGEAYEGDGWAAWTRGDLLGGGRHPYRIFDVSIAVRPETWRAALRHLCEWRWKMLHWPPVDAPEDVIGWASAAGYLPDNWPLLATEAR